jgi:hypothetical protein
MRNRRAYQFKRMPDLDSGFLPQMNAADTAFGNNGLRIGAFESFK